MPSRRLADAPFKVRQWHTLPALANCRSPLGKRRCLSDVALLTCATIFSRMFETQLPNSFLRIVERIDLHSSSMSQTPETKRMKLYFSRNPNPRLAVAVARFLKTDIEFEFAEPMALGQSERYLPLNPNLLLPILERPGRTLWESDAIACWLSRHAGSNFWRTDDEEPEMIRWISWAKENFVKSCDEVHWERGTKLRYGIGKRDERMVEEGLRRFHKAAAILECELSDRLWLLGETISFADFRMATFLPFNDAARLPIEDYPAITRWADRLNGIEAWRDPFRGLDAPQLPLLPTE